MTASPDFSILADTGALVVAEDGQRVIVFDRNTGGLVTATFVVGIIALITGGFGVADLIVGDPLPTLGAVAFVAVGLLAAAATFALARSVRTRRSRPLPECRTVAVLDRKRGLFSSAGGALVQLDQVRFERRMQATSSSPKLVAVTPGGTRVLKRGNPFDGGIGRVDEVLTAAATGSVRQP